jgi:hypothetical protein
VLINDKVILSQIEEVVKLISTLDYGAWNYKAGPSQVSPLHQQLIDRITSGNPQYIQSGLRSLKAIV